MQVNFLIAGMQKGGTTALDRFLRAHDDLCLPCRKEVHFFDDEKVNWSAPDYSQYHDFYPEKKGNQTQNAARLVGDITPIYSYWAPCAERIKAYNPQMKIILCLRDPVERAYSHWEMEVSRKAERLKFRAAIREGRDRIAKSNNTQHGCHRVFSYVERGFYALQIKRLRAYFPHHQFLYLENRNMKEDLPGTLDQICDFLGVKRFGIYPANETILPTRKRLDLGQIKAEDAAYLAGLYNNDTRETARLTGLDLSHYQSWT